MTKSEECIAIINGLKELGRHPDAFSYAFPYIHHFKERGGDASLESFYEHCQKHEIEGDNNLNVYRRLLLIQQKAKEFLELTPDSPGISSIKFQRFATEAAEEIPF
ncbi:MAG: hypothetical protein QF790_06910 [Gammaproteobacteria bacterium]|jgi:hypothetical protein|nr:hypothetical protein [Gammaproteobacteria bacterium]MDP6616878.1 hypothetical protein [Gammaproteobacteria bacterium]MDP6694562.1 hypothetical protein [Gammaproteobacteria bacterium]